MDRDNRPAFPDVCSDYDLYLSPHFDDICFSLGSLVSRRRKGILLTIFSNSAFVAKGKAPGPGRGPASVGYRHKVSTVRRSEDLAFCESVGLKQLVMGLDEAPVRDRHPFENSSRNSVDDASLHGKAIIDAALAACRDCPPGLKPGLYCPMGIGDHVDHLAILRAVMRHLNILLGSFRLGFYEDLYYASDVRARKAGIDRFMALISPAKPGRTRHVVDDVESKIKLVRIYESQIGSKPLAPEAFSPCRGFSSCYHEAVWTIDAGDGPVTPPVQEA